MPLKDRQPFKRETLDINTQQLDKEYFYCKHTQEIFKDYESLFQRVIQCNSLIWACSLTGRVGLTYQEAVESEKKARNILATFPEALKQPVLYITTLTKRNRIGDLCDDVFRYVRDRYFVGEKVELSIDGERKICEVTAVCSSPNKNSKSPKKSGSNSKEISDPAKQKYELYETDDADEIQICRVVEGKDISRARGSFSRNANKLFIKQHVTLKDGALVVKESSIKKYELDSPSLKQITGNITPDFASLSKNSPNKRANGQMDITKALMQKNGTKKALAKSKPSSSTAKDIVQKKFEEERKKKLIEREKEKEQMREEKLLIAKFKMEWSKPRDDLECDDLKDLPLPSVIKCNIPNEVFGDALMVLEFVHQFSGLLKAKRIYPHGFTFEMLEKALESTDIDGAFNDLLQMLFLATLVQQEEEGEEQVGVKNIKHNTVSDEALDDEDDISATKALLSAKVAATIPQYYHGTILRKMPLDSFTLTEMLRLHILASGSEVFPRFYERGMYVSQENPGIAFKRENPEVMKLLATSSVFYLNVSQRVKILNLLMAQLLTYESYRDYVEESAKKLKNAQYSLKQLRWARSRRGKEEKIKKKPEEKKESEENSGEAMKSVESKPDLTPEEKALEDAKFLEQSLKEEKELVSLIDKLQSIVAMKPIGRDRAYRRYWVFKSVGGIFVEDNDPFVGVCLSRPTPSQPASVSSVKSQDELPLSFMRKYLNSHNKDDKNGQSDKENESIDSVLNSLHNHSKAQKLLSDANPRINSPMKVNKRHSSSASSEDSDEKDLLKKNFGVCNSDPLSCPVHSTNRNPMSVWSVFYTEDHLNALIANLNPRGFREGQLRNNLIKEKVQFISNISSCPVNKLTGQVINEEPIEARKSNRHRSVFYNIAPEEALITTFRDALLENEEKLWSGALGVIKVNDRKLWREALMNGDYDMQTKCLIWSNNCKRNPEGLIEAADADEDKILHRSSSPTIVSSPMIVDFASALLQIGQGIEQRYLISPLADDEKYKKQKQKIAEKQEKNKAKAESSNKDETETTGKSLIKSPFHRWEESLMRCTSLSQLFIHLATLERSITWRKAVKHASCRICRKRGDPENMLLCDGCDGGYHMYCLKPPLTAVPTGDWFCPPCEPLPPKETRRAAKSYKELSDSEGDEEEEAEEDNDEDDNCDDDQENEAASGESNDEAENGEEEEEEEQNDDDDDDVEDDNNGEDDTNSVENDEDDYVDLDNEDEDFSEQDESDFCLKCSQGGDLICCEECPASFHLDCCDPPLKRIPRGTWLCSKCSSAKEVQDKRSKSNFRKSNSSSPPEDDDKESRRSSNRRSSNDSKSLPLDYNGCSKLLTQLSQHKDSWPFLKAVTRKEAPDYHKIIKRPLDLGLIRSKLNNQKYMTNSQFVADVYLMFQNCEVYNAAETPQYLSGKRLNRYFQSLLRQHKLDTNKRSSDTHSSDLPAKRSRH